MNKTTNNALRLAVLAALAGTSVAAYAQFPDTKVANELPTTTTFTLVKKAYGLTTAFNPGTSQNLQVTVNLSNNTKFAVNPSIECTVGATSASAIAIQAGAGANGTSGYIAPLTLGGANSTQAIFTMATALTVGSVKSCVVSAPSITVTGAHAAVVESITFKYGSLASSSVNGNLVSWNSGLTVSAAAKKTVTAKVTAGFNKLNAGVTVATGAVVAWKAVGAATATTAAIGNAGTAGKYMSTASITFAGSPLASTKTTAGVFVVAAAAGCATANKLAGTSAKGGASSVSFALTPAQIVAGVRGCFAYSGTSAIPAGTITAQLGGTARTNYSLPTPSSNDVLTVTRDGSSLSLLNMPRSTDTDAGFLRVYNTSTIAGAITATIYDQNGTALASNCSLSSSLAAGAALVMSAAQVETACGFTVPTTGRYRLEIAGAIPTMKGQMFARSSGVLTNVSADK